MLIILITRVYFTIHCDIFANSPPKASLLSENTMCEHTKLCYQKILVYGNRLKCCMNDYILYKSTSGGCEAFDYSINSKEKGTSYIYKISSPD